ncbi:MAG: hypothetical protein KBC96_10835 [Armatimonadetes bacterium]|nr:hypothetical protein [Armatimonadota bacterium]
MRVHHWIGALLCVLMLCHPVACEAATARVGMPPGSFLTKPVSNPEDLARLIETDKRVAERYSRLFFMNAEKLAAYVRTNLRVGQLNSTGKYTTYYISKGDRILVHQKTFKAGRRMLFGPDGRPIMDLECGNPLVKTLPQVVAQVKPVQQEIVLPPAEAPPAVVELPTEPPVVEAPVQEAPVIAQQMTVPEPQVEVLGVPPVEFSSAASLLSKAILPGLLTAAAASAVFSGGGGTPVPEPSGMIALGSCVIGLAMGVRFRRRR